MLENAVAYLPGKIKPLSVVFKNINDSQALLVCGSEEIADAVMFVVKNGYVTGETVNINGGMYYAP